MGKKGERDMANEGCCQSCGRVRPADAPVGLCPVCLLRAGQSDDSVINEAGVTETRIKLDSARLSSRPRATHGLPGGGGAKGLWADDESGGRPGRLELFGPIGRGGMGVVLKGRDGDLGRELAVKVLLTRYCDQPEMIRRFVEEAQIGGQLQHPGIVPVYELGTLADHRPYFAMKLIKGRTLAELLAGRKSAHDNGSHLLAIFEAVCQTMAYAHARGVIHRDLKPANIMVGSFGEVQVMDWGVAKVLGQSGEPTVAADATAEAHQSLVRTGRNHDEVGLSRPGTVVGTPAYMAPEQARGKLDGVDERADVFALGAILCEILTGRPVYLGSTSAEIELRAAQGDVFEAHARLGAAGADAELVSLARNCLAAEPVNRPRDARIVAERMTAHRAGVQEKLHAAELATVVAQARADEEAKRRALADQLAEQALASAALESRRRRLSLALAASIVMLVILGGTSATWLVQQRQTRLAKVDLALKESELLCDQAVTDQEGDIAKWQSARAALARSRELLEAVPLATTQSRIDELASRIDAGAAQAEIDHRLVTRLDEIRAGLDGDDRADTAYNAAFHAAGLDLVAPTLDPVATGNRLSHRPRAVARAAAGALDAWALVRHSLTSPGDATGWAIYQNLQAVARAADPDPWRNALHGALSTSDTAPLIRLAESPDLEQHDPAQLWFLGYVLEVLGDHDRAKSVLERAQRAHPGDYWLNTELGLVLMDVKRSGPGATSSFIITGAAPTAAQFHEAQSFFSAALALRPQFASAHHLLGTAYQFQGQWDKAIACYRNGLRLQPDDAKIFNSLGNVFLSQGKPDDAIAGYRDAIRLNPAYDLAHANLIACLGNQGKFPLAIEATRDALKRLPGSYRVHTLLGDLLAAQGKPDGAIDEYHEAIRLEPQYNWAHANLAGVLRKQGHFDLAASELRQALDLTSDASARETLHGELAKTERWQGLAPRLPALLSEDHAPRPPAETLDLAFLLHESQRYAQAARLFNEAMEQDPRLVADPTARVRYHAACAAALAADGRSHDEPALTDAERTSLRDRARKNFKSELATCTQTWHSGAPPARAEVPTTLRRWRVDPDLASVRESEPLSRLTPSEQTQWREFWAEVDRLLERSSH
jgi:tetratricopeptide (TPR) repeat protein/tRNA A-37 threonylcarbamoyl transferase component Bud32